MPKNNDYFTKRFIKQENEVYKLTEAKQKELKSIYKTAQKELEKDLASFIERYSLQNDFTNADLVKMLNTKELVNFRYSIKDYVKEIERLGANTPAGLKLKKELDIMAGRTRVSRKQELITSIKAELGLAGQKVETATGNHLKKVVHFAYDDTGKIVRGAGNTLAKLDTKLIERVVSQNWKGANYSARIWKNRTNLAKKTMKNITTGLIQGWDFKKMSSKLQKDMGTGYYEARRLIHTETTGALENAKELAYKEMGVSKYRFIATVDDRTSSICLSLDGKEFEMKERQIGINCPFCHPFCRSVTVPVIDKKVKKKIKVEKPKKEIEKIVKSDIIKEEKKVIEDKVYDNLKGDEINKFFKEHESYKKWEKKLSIEDIETVKRYTEADYVYINTYSRYGNNDWLNHMEYCLSDEKIKEIPILAKNLENAIDGYTVEKSFKTYRGTEIMYKDNTLLDLKVGDKRVIDKGFLSSSLDKKVIDNFMEKGVGEKYIFEITVKKGSKQGAFIDEFSDMKGNEREFLFKPNTEFKVVSLEESKDGSHLVKLECE